MAGRVWRRGKCQTLLFFVWHATGATAHADVRALAEGRTPEGGRSEEKTPKAPFGYGFGLLEMSMDVDPCQDRQG